MFSVIRSIFKLLAIAVILPMAGLAYLFLTEVTPGNVQFRTTFACYAGLHVLYPLSRWNAVYSFPAPRVDCECFAAKFVAEVGAARAVAGLVVLRVAIPDVVRQILTKRGITAAHTDYVRRDELQSLQGSLLAVAQQCSMGN